MEFENVPILLIGLGGIGSSIVNEVYGKLKKENANGFVEAMVFDTDQGSLNELTYIEKDCKIQTSTDKTVGYVLDRDENAKGWFPTHPRILDMQLINGAGQIRAVSRLALRAAMKEGKLSKIQTVKDRLYRLGGNAADKGVRIMIVSSLMGGTGSGIFLQVPLYLREMMESKFGINRIEIQGTFLLPDVLKGAIDGETEKKNIYANAYACFRELNAIIQSLIGKEDVVELEYRPDQIETTKDIAVKTWPYDYCYIYDKEDAKGRVLANIDDYKKMIAGNLFSQIYGPVSDKLYGHFINEIRNIIRENCENIFGGVSVGKLVYPYEDICDYITNKVLQENLEDKLLRIDESFNRKMKQFEENKQNGIDTDKPNIMSHYIDEFRQLSTDGNNLFFKLVAKQVNDPSENGENTREIIDDYFYAVEDQIAETINNFVDEEKIVKPNRAKVDDMVEAELRNCIYVTEDEYKNKRKIINSKIENKAENKANIDFGYFENNTNSFFDNYVKRDKIFINPVGTRYILYSMKQEYGIRIEELKDSIDTTEKSIIKYEENKCSDLFKNKTTLSEILEHALNADKNPLDKITIKTLKKFKDQYIDEASKHCNLLIQYAQIKYEYAYYRRTYELIDNLISEYEKMFDKLDNQKTSIERRVYELENLHNNSLKTSTNIYILGNPEFKKQIWESIPNNTKNEALSNVLPEKMYEYLKKNCILKMDNKKTDVLGYDEIFNNLILKGCKDCIKNDSIVKEMLDINITQALYNEYKYAKELGKIDSTKDENSYIKNKLNELVDITQPFCPNPLGVNPYRVWGVNKNSKLVSEVGDGKLFITTKIEDVSDTSSNIVESDVLSKYEIMYLNSIFGLKVNDFVKLNDYDEKGEELGEYYVKYDALIKNIYDDNINRARNIEITPHLDKSWHLILPYIGRGSIELKDKAKAFIFSIPMQYVLVEKKEIGDNKLKIEYKKKIGQETATIIKNADGTQVQGSVYSFYDGMMHNPRITYAINEDYNKHLKEIQNEIVANDGKAALNDNFIKKICDFEYPGYDDIKNVLDVIIKIYSETRNVSNNERDEIMASLNKALFEIINEVVSSYEKDEDIIKENVLTILKKIKSSSNLAKSLKESTAEYNSTLGVLLSKIKEYEEK